MSDASPYQLTGSKPPAVNVERREDGVIILTCPYPSGPLPRSTAHVLIDSAERHPERTLVAEQDEHGEWQHMTYAEAVEGCRRVAQWLLEQGASVDRPLAILSGSSRKHFLMAWGAVFARVPYVPVSLSYSTVEGAYPKLRAVLDKIQPKFIFAEDLQAHAQALQRIEFNAKGVEIISATAAPTYANKAWDEVISTIPTEAVDDSIEQITHDTVTRYMFTSGSTGMPKGVIHTHGMSCQLIASSAGLRENPSPVNRESRILEWMPWSHVGAGVTRMAAMLYNGASIYLDTGKPTPADFHKTVKNLPIARPTSYAGAPLGWSMVADALEADEALAKTFFAHLNNMAFGSAAMPQPLAKRLEALTVKYTGKRLAMGTSLASTEVASGLTRYWICEDREVMGLPVPDVEVKLIPFEDKYEVRMRSKTVTPGYINDPEKTAESFDEEGFFKMGDAVRFFDSDNPVKGLCFAGRVSEEFKLQTGTWVSAGTLRAEVVAAASPYVRDVVVCGLNETYIALMIWPNLDNCAKLTDSTDSKTIATSKAVQTAIAEGLARHNQANPGSSKRIRRFLLLDTQPDLGAYEITDKGYINQSAAQRNRADQIARLYREIPDGDVMEI